MNRFSNKTTRYWLLAAGLLLSFVASVYKASQVALSHDEAYTFLHYARAPFSQILSDYSNVNNHILHSLLMRVCYLAFGHEYFPLRIPALAGGALLLISLFLLCRRINGRVLWLWPLAVASLPAIIDYNFFARGYSLSYGMSFLALYLLSLVVSSSKHQKPFERKTLLRMAAAGLLFGLSHAAMPTMLIFNVSAGASFLVVYSLHLEAWRLKSVLTGAILLALTSALVTFLFYAQVSFDPKSLSWGHTELGSFFAAYYNSVLKLPFKIPLEASNIISLSLVLLLSFSLWLSAVKKRMTEMFLLLTLLFLLIFFGSIRPVFGALYPFPRGFLCAAPLMLFAIFCSLEFLPSKFQALSQALGLSAVLALTLPLVIYSNTFVTGYGKTREGGIPQALTLIEANRGDIEEVLLAYYPQLRWSLEYELIRKPRPWTVPLEDKSQADFWITFPPKEQTDTWTGVVIPLADTTHLKLLKRTYEGPAGSCKFRQ